VQISYLASPNFRRVSRRTITAIVLHYTQTMTLDTAVRWLQKPESHTSYHYLVGRDGAIAQMVKDQDIAQHAGRSAMRPHEDPPGEVNVNEFSLGIALVGTADSGFTDRQMAGLYTLIEILVARYKVPPDRIVGHEHVAPGRQTDPSGFDGQFNWRRLHEVSTRAFQ
jgi:N-acetylmuramoyl-L-alanine amidase